MKTPLGRALQAPVFITLSCGILFLVGGMFCLQFWKNRGQLALPVKAPHPEKEPLLFNPKDIENGNSR